LALKTITGKVIGPDNNARGLAQIKARLSQPATIPGTAEVLPVEVAVQALADGTYSIQLHANNDLTPNGTFYTILEEGGVSQQFTVVVPTSAGPFVMSQIMAAAPTPAPPAALDSAVVHIANPETIVGAKTFQARQTLLADVVHSYRTATEAELVSGLDASLAETVYVNLTVNRVMAAPINPAAGQRMKVVFTQPAGGNCTVTLPAAVSAPAWTLNLGASAITELNVEYNGTTSKWVLALNPPPGLSQALPGLAFATTGDSITARNSDPTNNVQGDSWMTFCMLASNGALRYKWNGGVGGFTSTQLLAQFVSAVLATNPKLIGILVGTNDALDGSNKPTTTATNIKAMVAAAQAAGAGCFIGTIPPVGMAALGTPANCTLTQQASGGTLGAATYAYRTTVTNALGETLASVEQTIVVAAGTTNQITIRQPYVNGMTGWKIYGRTSGAELLIGSVTISGNQTTPNLSFVDTGAVTPSGALPGADTTGTAVSAPNHLKVVTINDWIRAYCAAYGIPMVDFWSVLVDTPTGQYKVGYSIDGTHPTNIASKLMGQAAWTAISSWVAANRGFSTLDDLDPTNLFSHGCLGTGSASLPTGWASFGGSGANFIDTRGALSGFAGNAFSCQMTASGDSRFHSSSSFTTGFSVGDRLAVTLRVQTTGHEVGGMNTSYNFKAVPSDRQVVGWMLDDVDVTGCLTGEWTVQAGDTGYYFNQNEAYGTGTGSSGEITVKNLTTGATLTP
jgi:lysophospholipase L1-like esterase